MSNAGNRYFPLLSPYPHLFSVKPSSERKKARSSTPLSKVFSIIMTPSNSDNLSMLRVLIHMFISSYPSQGLGLNDYLDVIKTPMDLGTVKKNLKANKYKFVEDCILDIFLVWENCKTYNAQGSVWLFLCI